MSRIIGGLIHHIPCSPCMFVVEFFYLWGFGFRIQGSEAQSVQLFRNGLPPRHVAHWGLRMLCMPGTAGLSRSLPTAVYEWRMFPSRRSRGDASALACHQIGRARRRKTVVKNSGNDKSAPFLMRLLARQSPVFVCNRFSKFRDLVAIEGPIKKVGHSGNLSLSPIHS